MSASRVWRSGVNRMIGRVLWGRLEQMFKVIYRRNED